MTYEVLGYDNQAAFDSFRFQIIEDGLARKADALRIGKRSLDDFPIVKVQSSDREFIEMLRRAGDAEA